VVHRDLKPANIVLRVLSRSPVVVDFGLAVDLETPEWNLEGICGTPLFMAPEAMFGQTPDASWDAYSLGITAAEILLDDARRRLYHLGSNTAIFEAKSSGRFDSTFRETVLEIADETLRGWCLELTDPESRVRMNAVRRASEWLRACSDA
jgi:serine/threonine-protein kinase